MTPNQIKRAYKRLGLTQEEIARKLQCDQTVISKIIHRRGKALMKQEKLAEILGLEFEVVWPEAA